MLDEDQQRTNVSAMRGYDQGNPRRPRVSAVHLGCRRAQLHEGRELEKRHGNDACSYQTFIELPPPLPAQFRHAASSTQELDLHVLICVYSGPRNLPLGSSPSLLQFVIVDRCIANRRIAISHFFGSWHKCCPLHYSSSSAALILHLAADPALRVHEPTAFAGQPTQPGKSAFRAHLCLSC